MHKCRIMLQHHHQLQMLFIYFILFWLHVQVSAESANQFGELIADPITKELLHYTEKPETFVCTMCNFCAQC